MKRQGCCQLREKLAYLQCSLKGAYQPRNAALGLAALEILSGADVGTLFEAPKQAMRARKHWIAYTLKARGAIILDEGAARAICAGKSSLLPVGVVGVRGGFGPGDAVELTAVDGRVLGRGLTRLGTMDTARSAGKKGSELELLFGNGAKDVIVVHKDDLVLELPC